MSKVVWCLHTHKKRANIRVCSVLYLIANSFYRQKMQKGQILRSWRKSVNSRSSTGMYKMFVVTTKTAKYTQVTS